jgi:Uma2 family endonuclease
MRALVIAPDPSWLEERRRLGLDRFDEVWDGVLHVVPAPSSLHQILESDLEAVLRPIAASSNLRLLHNLSVYDATVGSPDYRTPDLVVADPVHISKRGVEARAELVIELLSPNDESRDKLPFYARCGIPEVWLVEPITRAVEVYVLRGATYFAATPDRDGSIQAPRLGLELRTSADGPKLLLGWRDGNAAI